MIGKTLCVMLITTSPAIVFAQDPPPPDATRDDETAAESPPTRPIDESRRYRNQRERSLLEHDRWDRSRIPPGYTVHTWQREMASTEAYDRGYEDGFIEGWRAAQRDAAQARSESLYDAAYAQGMERFRNREYGAALRNFILAAKNDQGDPVSRLHAAHSMTALRHYDDAYLLVRRALQLQPKLAYVPMDIRSYFASRAEFDAQVDALRAHAAADEKNAKLWALLGYFLFFSDQHAEAHRAIQHAADVDPTDPFIVELLEAARLSVPATAGPTPADSKRY